MSKESKIILLITGLVLAGIAVLIAFVNSNQQDPTAIQERIVREDSRTIGTGEVQVVEFGDYQCPGCASAHPTVEKLKEEFEGKITFTFRNFPLPGHANGRAAAEAAEAAGNQGKFWEMHDKLFETQTQWGPLPDPTSLFSQYAEELKLDKEKFIDDVTSEANKDRITTDQSDGYAVGVNATPTFFINGQRQSSFEYEPLKKAIEAELKK